MITRRLLNTIRETIYIAISMYICITYFEAFYKIIMSAIKYVFGLIDIKHIINIIGNGMKSMFNYTTTIFNMIKPDINLKIDTYYWEYLTELIAIISGIVLPIILLICCAICRFYINKFRPTIRPKDIPPRWLRD